MEAIAGVYGIVPLQVSEPAESSGQFTSEEASLVWISSPTAVF